MTTVLARKYHPCLWELIGGEYRMTPLYAELFHQYVTGEISQNKFLQRTSEIEAIYDGLRKPF